MRYGRDFLIKFKDMPMCKQIPAGLGNLKKSFIFTADGHQYHANMGGGAGSHYQRPQGDRNRVSVQIYMLDFIESCTSCMIF